MNISLYVYSTLCLSIHLLRALGLFQLLVIINNAAVSTGVQVSIHVLTFSSFGHTLRSGIVGSCDILCLAFWGTTKLFFIAGTTFYISTSNIRVFLLLRILTGRMWRSWNNFLSSSFSFSSSPFPCFPPPSFLFYSSSFFFLFFFSYSCSPSSPIPPHPGSYQVVFFLSSYYLMAGLW